jgi:hypothetical protein
MRFYLTAAAALLIAFPVAASPVVFSDGCLSVPVRAADGSVLYWNAAPSALYCTDPGGEDIIDE